MPELRVDIEAIGRNTEVVADILRRHSLDLVAVTKGCLGDPHVAAAMLAGGAVALADTRDQNLRRLRSAFPKTELHRIYLPSIAEAFATADITYVSSREGTLAVAERCAGARPARVGRSVGTGMIMIMVETGDEREGIPVDQLPGLAQSVAGDARLHLIGVATNYACFRGKQDGIRSSVEELAQVADMLRAAGYSIERVSGGNSSLLSLLVGGERLPGPVTELRCGEALLLGQDALRYQPIPGCSTSACAIRAEVVEEYTRPASKGPVRRLVVGMGRQDLGAGAVRFTPPGLQEIGRSADYLVVEAEGKAARTSVGTMIEMIPSYEALVAAWTSPYVELRFRGL